jgi:phosphate transport system protein
MIEDKINDLKAKIVEYSSLVEKMVAKSIKGLVEKKSQILAGLIENDEPVANDYEIEIDEMCITMIVKYQPTAKDLRTILMILKMNNDLERIADHAVNITQRALSLIEQPPVKPLIDIPRMANEATRMLGDSISSFIQEDSQLARKVCENDSVVDALRNQIIRELLTYMIANPATIERALLLIDISKNLERIADLSTNIGEDVIYLVDAKVIKHNQEKNSLQ